MYKKPIRPELIPIKIGTKEWWSVYINFNGKDKYEDAIHFDTKKEAEDKIKELLKTNV